MKITEEIETERADHERTVALLRECAIRTHLVFPTNEEEFGWHNEGVRHDGEFMEELFEFMIETQ